MEESERNLDILVPRTKNQREFLKKWVKVWRVGNILNIENEYGYLFDYMKQLIRRAKTEKDLEKIEAEILKLQMAYPINSHRKSKSFNRWAIEYRSDTYIARHSYKEAINVLSESYKLPIPPDISKILSLKLYIGDDINGWDLLYFYGTPRVTRWGRENLEILANSAEKYLSDKRVELNSTILPHWRNAARLAFRGALEPLRLFDGINHRADTNQYGKPLKPNRFETTIRRYNFNYIEPFSIPLFEILKIIENNARESQNLPKIGEGWISETDLYYTIKEQLPDLKVAFHASPKWLGKQHLDVFIPELKVALEFQGEQHDRPIEYFGGEASFIKTQKHDIRKLKLCSENDVRLIYIRAGYSLNEVLRLINDVKSI